MNQPFKVGAFLCAWHENPPFRRVGYADQIARSIRHNGWYCSEDDVTGERARGVVYRLNHARGFVAGMEDPCNGGPAAVLEMNCIYDDETDAALAADRLAERYAEDQRDENNAWQAGLQAGSLETKARERNVAVLQICKERRALLATLARLERDAAKLIRDKCDLRRQRDRIRDSIPKQHLAHFHDAYSCA